MAEKLTNDVLKQLSVTNVIEMVVDEQFPVVMQKFPGACCCVQCLSDIKALALNNLKPHYVSSDRGNLFERINTSDMIVKVDVLRAMTEAAEKVTRNPRHTDK
ncbi:late competence development ComFB family protein [Anaerovibrio sp.]|uniref:late competence development ComFB family protein n=1 Tax=Anaerovibrio sp. TaxID=1872532 RepID=UPI003F185BF6